MKFKILIILLAIGWSLALSQSTIPITIMTYNTSDDGTDWTSNPPPRLTNLHNVISNVNPDIIVAVEIANTNTDVFLTDVLGSSYTKGTFIPNTHYTGPNSNCLYYKTSKFVAGSFSNTVIPTYDDNGQYRDFNKFKITQNGGETIVIYAVHLHPGNSSYAVLRTEEIQYLLDYISNNAPSSTSENFIVLGDYNINRADENAYKNLLYDPSDGLNGYFYDPLNPPPSPYIGGDWGSSWSYTYTYSSSNLQERYDMILMSDNVWNTGSGVHYNGTYTTVGNPTPNADEMAASNHLPVYAVFDFTDIAGPVELESFEGKFNGESVSLDWKTATEVNNFGFNIERSFDSTNWSKVGFVKGYGNSNVPHNYSFIDNNFISSGNYFYRLKQIDNDGSFEYSNIITVNVVSPVQYTLRQNYPNPFNPTTTIEYSLPKDSFVIVKVFDILGRQVKTLIDKFQNKGIHKVNFNGRQLASGTYFYRIIAASKENSKSIFFNQTKSCILLK